MFGLGLPEIPHPGHYSSHVQGEETPDIGEGLGRLFERSERSGREKSGRLRGREKKCKKNLISD
jgi:hypothetical protein